jgi:nucleoside-diphosphate-sugar epimerase
MNMYKKTVVALVGGTGDLGSLIAKELLGKPNVQLRMLVRPESKGKAAGLENQGVQVVEGSLGKDNSRNLAALCQGASTVISAIQGGPDVIVDGQRELLLAAREAGAKRFVPSDFSLDMFKVKVGQIISSDWRRQFATIAEDECGDVEVVHVLNGGFLDRQVVFGFINIINVDEHKAYFWGEGKQPMDYTTYADTARYTAEVAVDDKSVPKVFSVAGDSLSFEEMVRVYETETGRKIEVVRLGSMKDLDARIDELKQDGYQNFRKYLPLMYYRAQLNGDGKLDHLMNGRYPSIKPTTVREYISQEKL